MTGKLTKQTTHFFFIFKADIGYSQLFIHSNIVIKKYMLEGSCFHFTSFKYCYQEICALRNMLKHMTHTYLLLHTNTQQIHNNACTILDHNILWKHVHLYYVHMYIKDKKIIALFSCLHSTHPAVWLASTTTLNAHTQPPLAGWPSSNTLLKQYVIKCCLVFNIPHACAIHFGVLFSATEHVLHQKVL